MDIPLIDLRGRETDTAARIAAACEQSGFFGVVNHAPPHAPVRHRAKAPVRLLRAGFFEQVDTNPEFAYYE